LRGRGSPKGSKRHLLGDCTNRLEGHGKERGKLVSTPLAGKKEKVDPGHREHLKRWKSDRESNRLATGMKKKDRKANANVENRGGESHPSEKKNLLHRYVFEGSFATAEVKEEERERPHHNSISQQQEEYRYLEAVEQLRALIKGLSFPTRTPLQTPWGREGENNVVIRTSYPLETLFKQGLDMWLVSERRRLRGRGGRGLQE